MVFRMRSSVFYILKMPLLSLGNFEEQKGQKMSLECLGDKIVFYKIFCWELYCFIIQIISVLYPFLA